MRRLFPWLGIALLFLNIVAIDDAEARLLRRRGGNRGGNFVRVRPNQFGFFGRSFFPFGFIPPRVALFEGNAINPFFNNGFVSPFFSTGAVAHLGAGFDFGPNPNAALNAAQAQPAPQSPAPAPSQGVPARFASQPRPVDPTPAAPEASSPTPDFSPSDTQRLLSDAVRADGHASANGQWDGRICEVAQRYAEELAAKGGLDGHAGFNSTRYPKVVSWGYRGSSEIIAMNGYQDVNVAARQCVRSWRTSPGHYQHMHPPQAGYCYAMAQGNNGWFCVGLFGS